MTVTETTKRKQSPRRKWRLILKITLFALLLFVIITAARILIPALQYRDAVMTLLHYSDECHAPCFMGITPGETTMEEALEILENHEWVKEVNRHFDFAYPNYSDQAPEFLHGQSALIHLPTAGFEVLFLTQKTELLSFLMIKGIPDTAKTAPWGGYAFHYSDDNLAISC